MAKAKPKTKPKAKAKRKPSMKLTPKQEEFALAYLETGNAAEAYKRAYNVKATTSANAIYVSACRILANPKIQLRVADLKKTREDRIHKKFEVTIERVVEEYARIAFADIRNVVEWSGEVVPDPEGAEVRVAKNQIFLKSSDRIDPAIIPAISEVSQSPTGGMKVKLHPKLPALDALGRHLKMFVDVKEVSGPGGVPLIPEDGETDKRKIARAVLGLMRDAAVEAQMETEDE